MRTGQRYIEQGDTDTAKTYYQAVADSKSKTYSDMARLMVARLSPDTAPTETLKPILKRKSNIWYPFAAMDAALYEAGTNNNIEKAIALLDNIIESETAEPSIKEKAKALKHLYTIKLSQAVKEE